MKIKEYDEVSNYLKYLDITRKNWKVFIPDPNNKKLAEDMRNHIKALFEF
jgi:hypothetical protein